MATISLAGAVEHTLLERLRIAQEQWDLADVGCRRKTESDPSRVSA
jgi:hypothetical protein